jgi:cysteinyl-tRNA synthetase
MDEVLGLRIRETAEDLKNIPSKVKQLVKKREELRSQKKFNQADKLRKDLEEMGFRIEDTKKGPKIRRA